MTEVIDDGEDIQDEETAQFVKKLEELKKERDFYLNKLREIELICLQADDTGENPLIQEILNIIYEPWPFAPTDYAPLDYAPPDYAPPDYAPPDDVLSEHVEF